MYIVNNRAMTTAMRVLVLSLVATSAACGGGSGGSSAPVPTGALTVSDCVIAAGTGSCEGTVSWTTSNTSAPRVLLDATTLSTAPAGSALARLGAGPRTVTLLDGSTQLDQESISGACVAASAWDGSSCRAFAVRTSARAPTTFVESGAPVTLEVVVYSPLGSGPFPAVMFNHGSTGSGDDPTQFTITYTNETVARFFAERGWLVAFPQRRGRGTSGGTYDEGLTPDRSRYSCLRDPALAGFEHALQDVDAAAEYLRSRSDVDASRVLSAGTSRGGILAIVHAAQRPGYFVGAVNFVGGWLGEGCQDALDVNRPTFARGAMFQGPTIWLYGDNDSFYSLAHSRGNFDAFVAAGGRGSFGVYTRAPTLNGHFIVNDASLWSGDLDAFLGRLGP
jgi:dienelactone hydrolase